jgi:hypothetical protein
MFIIAEKLLGTTTNILSWLSGPNPPPIPIEAMVEFAGAVIHSCEGKKSTYNELPHFQCHSPCPRGVNSSQ